MKNAYLNLDQHFAGWELWLHGIEIGLFPSVCGDM
jgi:hypothetical protein